MTINNNHDRASGLPQSFGSFVPGGNLKDGLVNRRFVKIRHVVHGRSDVTAQGDLQLVVGPEIDVKAVGTQDIPFICHPSIHFFFAH
jgi:hypothetical protein